MYEGGNYQVSRRHEAANRTKFARVLKDFLAEFDALGLPAPASVFDIGCFTGEFLDAAAAGGLATFGFEPMGEAVSLIGARHQVWSGDLVDCPGPGTLVDLVTLNDVIEHVGDPRQTLRAAARFLAPGGLLILTTPDVDSWAGTLLGRRWGVFDGMEHLVLFGREGMARTLDAAGLRPVHVRAHWKTLTLSYLWEMAGQWQFRTRLRPLPSVLQGVAVRVNVGEMLVVARRA
jgi:SAM-dependent methyltransferase